MRNHLPGRRTRFLGLILACGLVALPAWAQERSRKEKKDDAPKAEAPAPVVPPREGETRTITLFDGKDLEGWEGHTKHWSVVDGEIVGNNTEPVPVSTYLLTRDKYTDFRLTGKFKLAESEMHSGIALWGRVAPERNDPYTYQGHLVMFPSAYGLHDLYRRNGIKVDTAPAKKAGKQHEWNDIEILAQGNRIRVAINGEAVLDWRDPKPELVGEGPIGLQLHSNKVPQEVRFKALTIETFPKEDRLITVK